MYVEGITGQKHINMIIRIITVIITLITKTEVMELLQLGWVIMRP